MGHSWSPSLLAAEVDALHLGPPKHWPACPRWVGLLPARLSEGLDKDLLDAALYHLYGMYSAVLAEHMASCHGFSRERQSRGSPVITRRPTSVARYHGCPQRRRFASGWACHPLWPGWGAAFANNLVRWAGALAWQQGPGESIQGRANPGL